MSKKLKFNIDDIKVQSFVTGLDEDVLKKMNGGTGDVESNPVNACPTPQTRCGMTNNPCYSNCSPPPAAC